MSRSPGLYPKLQSPETLTKHFECTNWDTFFDSSDTIDETVDVISEYINFCVDTIVPVKSIKSYPNNKPWITKDIRSKIHEKNRIKSSPDRTALKKCQEELDTEIVKIRISPN